MKRLVFLFTVFLMIWTLGGCGDAAGGQRASESTFLANFSIGPVLEANEQYLMAMHTISGGAVSEPPDAFFQKHEEAIVQVDETNLSAFMKAVRFDIEELLTSSGAEIHGRGQGGNGGETPEGTLPHTEYYSLRYRLDRTEGVVNIWAVRDTGTYLTILVHITESQGA